MRLFRPEHAPESAAAAGMGDTNHAPNDAEPSRAGYYNAYAGQDVGRIQSLADAVFAVAMTLLVLDLRLPDLNANNDSQLLQQLASLAPHLAAYVLSFVMLGTFWLALHTLLALCGKSDRTLNWSVLVFLLFVTTLPFSASVLAIHTFMQVAIGLYWLNLAALGGTLAWAVHRARGFVHPDRLAGLTLISRRLIFAQVLYAVAALLCLVSSLASLIALGIFQLFFAISPRLPWRI